MSRRKGSINKNSYYYSVESLQKKSLKLSELIDKYIEISFSNQRFNKLVDFDDLHKSKDHLKEIGSMKIQ